MKNTSFVSKAVLLGVFLFYCLLTGNMFLVYAEESVQDVIKLIQDRSKDIKSYQAKFNLNMQGPQGEMAMSGDIKFKRPDKLKMELSLVNIADAKQLMISDGITMWQYVPALKMASKVDISALKKEFGDTYLSQPKEDISQPLKDVEENSLRYLGKENIEGKEYFILEAKPKALPGGEKTPFAKIKIWIDSESGLEQKAIFYDEQEKEALSRKFNEVKTNLEFDDSEFTFAPPEGVKVMDMTDNTRKMLEAQKASKEVPAPLPPEASPPSN